MPNCVVALASSLPVAVMGSPSRMRRAYAVPMSAPPITHTAPESQGLRVLTCSLCRPELMRSVRRDLPTTRRLNTSVTAKITARHSTVSPSASGEKMKRKFATCVLNSEAVKKTMSCERPTPRAMPIASAASETMRVSRAMMRAT